MLAELKSHHAAVTALMGDLEALIGRPLFPCQELAAVRLRLSRVSAARSRYIAETVGPALLARLAGPPADDVRALLAEAVVVGQASSAHIVKWNGVAVAADWPGYARDARGQLASMRARIERETATLYPLLDAGQRAAA